MPPVTSISKPNEGIQKPPQNLPFVQKNQLLQPIQPQQFTQKQTEQGNINVLGQAQNLASNAATPNQTMGLVEQQTRNLIQNQQPLVTDKFIQNQVGQGDRNRADAFKAFQQTTADVAGTGFNREAAFNLALKGGQERTDQEQALRFQQLQSNRQAQLENLNLGQQVAQTQSGLSTEALNRLLNTRAAGEGERSQLTDIQSKELIAFANIASGEKLAGFDNDTKLAIADMNAKLQQGMQLTQQDFVNVQNSLDRAHQTALAAGDNNLALRIEQMRGDLSREGFASQERVAFAKIASDENMQEIGIGAQTALTELQGRIQSGQQLTDQDFRATESALDRALTEAENAGDRELALRIEGMKTDLAREGFASSEKVAFARIASDENMQAVGIGAQTALTELQGRINRNDLLTKLDFETLEGELDRDHQTAINNNDNETRLRIEEMQGSLQKEIQAADQRFTQAENLANRSWNTSERLEQNQFDAAEKVLDRDFARAEALEDRTLQAKIESDRSQLQLKLQTNDMTHDEKMTFINNDLETARLDGNVAREKELMKFGHGQEMDKIKQEQGFEQSLVYLKDNLAQAMATQDFERTKVLTEMQFVQEMKIHTDTMAIQNAKLELEQQGVDMAKIDQQYNFLQNEISNGRLDPVVALDFLKSSLGAQLPSDFEFKEPNANAIQDALTADYKNQQFQFALTIGDADGDGKLDAGVYDDKGKFIGLNNENLEQFTNHMTSTLYDIEGGDITTNKRIGIKSGELEFSEFGGIDSPVYKSFQSDNSIPKLAVYDGLTFVERSKADGKARSLFTELEGNEFINVNGTIMHVDSINREERTGDDDTIYVISNVLTGETTRIVASDRSGTRRTSFKLILN
jgi:hypothetical protein